MAKLSSSEVIKDSAQTQIDLKVGDPHNNALSLLDAYAQRNITLGQLLKLRRQELGLTSTQVMNQSGYFIYRSQDLEKLENDELKSIHEIWFTILSEPLQIDFELFLGAYERKSPLSTLTSMQLRTLSEIEEELDRTELPKLLIKQARRSRSCDLSQDWITLSTLAKAIELTPYQTRALVKRAIALNPALSEWRRTVPLGKSKQQALYHVQFGQYLLLQLKNKN